MKPERTLILVKPDAVKRGLIGVVIRRFERCGLTIVGLKMMVMDDELAAKHYQQLTHERFYPSLAVFMTSGPLVAMAVEGAGAISKCRMLCGATVAGQQGKPWEYSRRFRSFKADEPRAFV